MRLDTEKASKVFLTDTLVNKSPVLRVKSAMANAKSKGVKLGRPQTTAEQIPQIFYRHYPSFKSGSLNLSEFARVCGLSRTTVYKYVGLLEG